MFFLSTPQISPVSRSSDLLIQNKSYFFKVTLIAALLVLLSIFTVDQSLTLLFQNDDLKWLIARKITDIGLFTPYFASALFVYCGFLMKEKLSMPWPLPNSFKQASHWLLLCLLFSGFWTHFFKFLIGRQRPKISPDFDPMVFSPLNTHWDFHSLPSGHTQVVFTVATFLSFYFPTQRLWIYSLAAILAFTRVMTRDHFLSDVIMGSVVGHLSAAALILFLHAKYNLKPSVASGSLK